MTRWIIVLLLTCAAALPRPISAQGPRSASADRGGPNWSDPAGRLAPGRQPATAAGPQPVSVPQSGAAAADGRRISPPGEKTAASSVSVSYGRTLGWLAVVLAAFVIAAKLWRRNDRERRAVPEGLVEVLGQHALDARHAIRLVRIGQRVLVLGSSPEGLRTLSEITEPDEVSLILGGRVSAPEQPRSSFAALLQQYRSARSDSSSRGTAATESAASASSGHPVAGRQVGSRSVAGQLVAGQLARESEFQASREPN